MKFDIPIPCMFSGRDFIDSIYETARLGFSAAETYDWRSLDLERVRNACADSGVKLLSMCTTEFRMTDPAYRQDWLNGLKESVQASQTAGNTMLITQVGPDTGEERARQHDSIVKALKMAVPILEESGIMVMIEPLNTLVNHKGYYLWSSAEAFDIIREVNSPFVRVIYDIYHQQVMEGNIIPNIVQNLDCIAHLHAAGHPGRHELQYGENDYKVIFEAVDKAGYTGYCGLEYTPLLETQESLETFKRIYM